MCHLSIEKPIECMSLKKPNLYYRKASLAFFLDILLFNLDKKIFLNHFIKIIGQVVSSYCPIMSLFL